MKNCVEQNFIDIIMKRVVLVIIGALIFSLPILNVYGANDIKKCRERIMSSKYLSYDIIITLDNDSLFYNQKVYVNDNNICLCLRDTYFINLSKSQYINIDTKREDFTIYKENYNSDSLKNCNWYYISLEEFKAYNDMDLYSKFWNKDLAKKLFTKQILL